MWVVADEGGDCTTDFPLFGQPFVFSGTARMTTLRVVLLPGKRTPLAKRPHLGQVDLARGINVLASKPRKLALIA